MAIGVVGAAVLGGIINEVGDDDNNPAAGVDRTGKSTQYNYNYYYHHDDSYYRYFGYQRYISRSRRGLRQRVGNKAQAVMLCAFLFGPWLVLCSADLSRAAKSCLHRAF